MLWQWHVGCQHMLMIAGSWYVRLLVSWCDAHASCLTSIYDIGYGMAAGCNKQQFRSDHGESMCPHSVTYTHDLNSLTESIKGDTGKVSHHPADNHVSCFSSLREKSSRVTSSLRAHLVITAAWWSLLHTQHPDGKTPHQLQQCIWYTTCSAQIKI